MEAHSTFMTADACPGLKIPGVFTRLRFLLIGLLFLGSTLGMCAQSISKEYQLKAAFLYNFTKFVDWPAQRFVSDTSPIVIAIVGKNPFGTELDSLVSGRLVKGRPIDVVFLKSGEDISAAHIVFIPEGEENRLNATLFGASGILTVGESPAFSANGGIVCFTLINEKVRFEINQASSDKAGLRLSGQLLKLATAIRKTPQTPGSR
jgi:hypothetical protein